MKIARTLQWFVNVALVVTLAFCKSTQPTVTPWHNPDTTLDTPVQSSANQTVGVPDWNVEPPGVWQKKPDGTKIRDCGYSTDC